MKPVGKGLVQSTTLFITRILTWGASIFAGAVATTSATANAGAQPATAAAPKSTLLGFSQTQSAAILIALLGLIAITVAADTIGRSWVTAASTDPAFLDVPWQCRRDDPPGTIGAIVAIRVKDNLALFVPDGSSKAEWVALKEIEGRRPV